MSGAEVEGFLTHLAVDRRVSASTENQALAAILFLYRQVLEIELPWLENVVRARSSARLPTVLSPSEVEAVLSHMWTGRSEPLRSSCTAAGCGGLRLRVKDVDLEYSQIVVRDGKGRKDRVTVLPDAVVKPLKAHPAGSRTARSGFALRFAGVEFSFALERKYSKAHMECERETWRKRSRADARRGSRRRGA